MNAKKWINYQPCNKWLRVDSIPHDIFFSVWNIIEINNAILLIGVEFKILPHSLKYE
ncbi:MAG: hypothetical protein GY853_16835 [PVC group bacterium]|nr:hypothetical protein [PVC group bacterium]